MTYATPIAVRNTTKTMNPFAPKTAEYYDEGQVAYVMVNNKGKSRVITSFGALGESYEVGVYVTLVSDANGRSLGVHTICAIVNFSTGVSYVAKGMSKNLFTHKMSHSVVK